MTDRATRSLTTALAGGPRPGPRWAVTGTDPRGEAFTTRPYRNRADAVDYAAEVNANGGRVKVRKVTRTGGHA